jgi:hypothetical protein
VSAGANLVCREANDVDCDLEEVCDGTSGSCPPDQTEDNGQTCGVGGACLLGACGSINGQCDELGALFGVQLLASPTCTSLINQDGCGDLVCRMGGSSSCTTLNDGSGLIQVEDGAPCGVGEQCFEGACLPTGDLPAANDQCPADPNKTTPGTCGCGVADVDADTDAVIDCVEPTPQIEAISGQAGGTLTFQVDNGTPGQRVHIVAGRPGGTVNVPGCSGSTLNLQSVTLLGFVTANAQGRAQLVRSPPANLGGVQRTFYAVELSSCGVSAPVAHTL